MIKLEKRSRLKERADRIFSLYIRTRDQGRCIVCGRQGPILEMENGHYIDRDVFKFRYSETNNNCQCPNCNRLHRTNKKPYREAMILKYGIGIVEVLEAGSRENYKLYNSEIKDIIKLYTKKLKEVK